MKTKLRQKNSFIGWQKLPLGDVAKITNGKTNSQDAVMDGKYPLFDRSISIKRSDKFLFDGEAIILPGEGSEFIPRYYNGKFDLHQRAYAIFADENQVYSPYLYQFLFANRSIFAQTAVGSTVKSLRLPIIRDVLVSIPPVKEQKKIAEILFKVDDEINKINEYILNTEKIKKGLMLSFFTQGISEKHLKKNNLGDLSVIKIGGTPRTTVSEYWNGDINWMASGEINQKVVNYTEKKITKLGLDNCNSDILSKNTVMIALAGQGKTRGTVAILNIETSCNQSLAGIKSIDESKILNKYIYYNLDSRYSEIRNINGDGGRGGLNLQTLRKIEISFPEAIEEQKRMVDILSSIDRKLEILKNLKEKLVQLKKGLMSDLLSGRVRTIK